MAYGHTNLDGDQKTAIIIITIFLAFLYILITLPSANVGVYMHAQAHEWTVADSNGVALVDSRGFELEEIKGYHCVLMERAFGQDNHITSFANDDYKSAHALYLELLQLEIDNPKLTDSGTSLFSFFLVWIGGIILGMFLIFLLKGYDPEVFVKIANKLNLGRSKC